MAGQCIRLCVIQKEPYDSFAITDEDGTEYTIETLFRVLYAASRRVVEEVYREEHDGTKQSRD